MIREKSIAEELRGLAGEFNVPVVTATQTTRSGYGNSDVELTDTSESFGLPATADIPLPGEVLECCILVLVVSTVWRKVCHRLGRL